MKAYSVRGMKIVEGTPRVRGMKSVEGTHRSSGDLKLGKAQKEAEWNEKCGRHTKRLRGMRSV